MTLYILFSHMCLFIMIFPFIHLNHTHRSITHGIRITLLESVTARRKSNILSFSHVSNSDIIQIYRKVRFNVYLLNKTCYFYCKPCSSGGSNALTWIVFYFIYFLSTCCILLSHIKTKPSHTVRNITWNPLLHVWPFIHLYIIYSLFLYVFVHHECTDGLLWYAGGSWGSDKMAAVFFYS